ncbi:histidine kinase N-terminal domain-containing protein [Fictibacillus phosphorivorans]|uniref:histidine kinase N-terminal domain-containing protein n=1 Tax=Fictibacillus phosphorivorans TaxID=1221500 RepID=UPI00203DF068|nr:histidine kinase N-terminal domain-containing protein [Fictibacillus phosphorivorans]MCM3720016.1 ATP-binding protein [Fictibacillus phosphorivorans]MCM3777714.1 ATP-binding protein [Fictibacillus phosphorivorans]
MDITESLITYMDENLPSYLHDWHKKVVITNHDIHKDKVIRNALHMIELVKLSLRGQLSPDKIKELAHEVAVQRLEAKINIGEFVYNVNLGRSEIVRFVTGSGISIQQLQPVIETINSLFDEFLYHAVKKYTQLKDAEIQEKTHFIDQSHKERLTILGQMSSSFVHEFRNPLTAVMGFVKLMQQENPQMKYIDIISHELTQLNFRISQFLHASRKGVQERDAEEFALEDLFSDILDFMYPSLVDADVNVVPRIDPTITLWAHRDELKQVLLNLIMNSIDALRQKKQDRRIMIYSKMESDSSDSHVHITISNNGPAIPPETMKTIFEPFYTTKELGTGIGLFVCKKIIEKHYGTISCTSDENNTTFTIVLPLEANVKKKLPQT